MGEGGREGEREGGREGGREGESEEASVIQCSCMVQYSKVQYCR